VRWPLPPLVFLLLAACGEAEDTSGAATLRAPRVAGWAPPPAGSVAQGAAAEARALEPPENLTDRALLLRGRESYDIYCAACHGFAGYGDGMVVLRGYPAPPSFHAEPQRELEPGQIVTVISRGKGLMQPMAENVGAGDRWAIAGYVKALQLSQHFPAARLPPDLRAREEP
jgi:mono/diheme cytochrome c family protein